MASVFIRVPNWNIETNCGIYLDKLSGNNKSKAKQSKTMSCSDDQTNKKGEAMELIWM